MLFTIGRETKFHELYENFTKLCLVRMKLLRNFHMKLPRGWLETLEQVILCARRLEVRFVHCGTMTKESTSLLVAACAIDFQEDSSIAWT